MVLATGTSPRQMKTVCDRIDEVARPRNYRAIGASRSDNSGWSLIDFVDVVVHVFSPDARSFYDLDNLWGDARIVQWQPEGVPTAG